MRCFRNYPAALTAALAGALLTAGIAAAEITHFETESATSGRTRTGWFQDFSEFFEPAAGDYFSTRATGNRGRILYSAGELREERGPDSEYAHTAVVTAVDARSGEVRWFHRSPILHDPGSSGGYAIYRQMVVAGRFVVLVGVAEGVATERMGALVVLDAKTGRERWTRTFLGPLRPSQLAASGKSAYVTLGPDLLAFDLRDGSERWRRPMQEDEAVTAAPTDIAVSGRHLVLGGVAGVPGQAYSQAWIRVHDARTGRPLWEDRFGNHSSHFSPHQRMQVRGRRAFFGTTWEWSGDPSERRWDIRAYDIKRGSLVWDDGTPFAPHSHLQFVELAGSTLLACGLDGDRAAVIKAWSPKGELLWSLRNENPWGCGGISGGKRDALFTFDDDPLHVDVRSGSLRDLDSEHGGYPFQISDTIFLGPMMYGPYNGGLGALPR